MEKRWNILEADASKVAALQTALKIHPILCELLVQRGIEDFDKAKQFFRPSLSDLHDPWLMKDMDKAVARITKAFDQNESIMVFGDYDVDGTTSVATLYQFLKNIHPTIDFYIPHRYREGYGVSKMGIDHAKATGITLIISVDCGIKSTELISYAKELGIDKYMIISNQIETLQGRDSDKLLEDVFESFLGALYKDQGYTVCYTFMRILLESIPDFSELIYKDTNFKNQIMIFYHKNKWAAPKYVDMEQFIDKKTGKKMFKEGILDYMGKVLCEGVATTKKAAQQMAAMHALLKFNLLNDDQIVEEFE
jgi:hypothetical protein